MTVACVLRSGGRFGPEWVWALKRGVNRWLDTSTFEFRCLSDVPGIGMWRIPLRYDWPGWWAKLELFRPDAFPAGETVLYLDLESLPVGWLTDIASYAGPFAMIRDLLHPPRGMQSGVMAFTPGDVTAAIWEAWMRDPAGHMRKFRGDGEWLNANSQPDVLQDIYPGQIVSIRREARMGPPAGARIVCAHGPLMQLNSPTSGWAHKQWRAA